MSSGVAEDLPASAGLVVKSAVGLLNEATAVMDVEHRRYRFLGFVARVEAGKGSIWLEVAGPPGTEDIMTMLLDTSEGSTDG